MFRGILLVLLGLFVAAPLSAAAQEQTDSASDSQQETDTAAQSQGGSVTEPPRQGPPPAPKLDESSDINQEFSEWRSDLQGFFDENAQDKNYTVAYGVGQLDSDDPASSRYIGSVTDAYKMALIQAYVNLSIQINPNGLNITTSDTQTLRLAEGDALRDAHIARCRNGAHAAYQKHLRKLEKDLEEDEAEKNSLLGSLAARLRNEEPEQPGSKEQQSPEDFVHTCHYEGESFSQTSSQNEQLEDVLSGGRVWATVLHKGSLGLILLRSSETAAMASTLKNQVPPSTVNRNAFGEIKQNINEELSNFEGIPHGIVGTRMMRLSNGEWAIYAYGAAQTIRSSGGQGFMANIRRGAKAGNSLQQARAELSRYSSLVINYGSGLDEIREVKQRWRIDCNVTRDECKRRMDEEQTFGEIVTRSFTARSDLKLVGSEEVFTTSIQDGPLTYYLAVQAWSPSLMAKNMGARSGQEAAAENAARGANSNRSGRDAGAKSESEVIILNEDW